MQHCLAGNCRSDGLIKGRVIHPQHWPEGLDYTGKRVAVIGSGATAITIVPNMARDAAKVTMVTADAVAMLPDWARQMLRLQRPMLTALPARAATWGMGRTLRWAFRQN